MTIWSPCWNTTEETIPPLAVMHRRRPAGFAESKTFKLSAQADKNYTQHLRGRDFLWDVSKCNAAAASRQNPAEFVFNGLIPIPPKSPGQCWEGYPARGLCDDPDSELMLYGSCGPKENSWQLSPNGSAFTILSFDPAQPFGEDVRVAWVAAQQNALTHVQAWTTSGSPTFGDVLEANADNLFPGRVRSWPGGDVKTGDDCWIKFIDWYDADSGDCYALHGKHYAARASGMFKPSGGTKKPLYVVEMGQFECWCKADSPISKGGSGTVSLYNDDFSDSTINRAGVLAKFMAVDTTQWCLLTRPMGTWMVQPVECPA